jgi:hypothetical protein
MKIILNNQNLKHKVVLLNYANKSFITSQKLNSKTAKSIGCFDEIRSFNSNDIDVEFQKLNMKILCKKRGNGFWLWKPYFIKKVLDELNFGEFLFYCDSGSYFTNSIRDLIELSIEKQQDIIPFELTHLESKWTKRDAFVLMECNSEIFYNTNQRLGGFVLFKKSNLSVEFVNNWLMFAQDERILTDIDNQSGFDNFSDYNEHRHDQSVFSLLTKKYKLKGFRDPSQYGETLKESYSDSTYETFVFLTRKRNFPLHIRMKKFFSRKKYFLLNLFSKKNNK